MSDDLFGDVLDVEDRFYREGFDAGVADGQLAGVIEGKIFGIERGYDKALELGKLRGRALVWKHRQRASTSSVTGDDVAASVDIRSETTDKALIESLTSTAALSKSVRLEKNIDALLLLTDTHNIRTNNTDDSVERLEDLTAKATTKAKVIANIVGEPFQPVASSASGIEDSIGLSARH